MHIWRSLAEVPADLGETCVIIGNFDGVHLGHAHVVARAKDIAGTRRIPVIAVTFDPHPMAVLRPEHAPTTLTSVEERAVLLNNAGVDHVLALPFDLGVAAWSPQEFIDNVLVNGLHAQAVVVGANFRFGHRAAGDVTTLRDQDRFMTEAVALDGGPQIWSSTYIRTCLAAGDVTGAAQALGRSVTVRGVVVRGEQRGRGLGYPTANVPARGLVPADGVYAGRLTRLDTDEQFPAAISVGTNPTFAGERSRSVEAYVLDRTDLELYDVEVDVTFVDRIRGIERFDSVEQLIAAMERDVERTREVLAV